MEIINFFSNFFINLLILVNPFIVVSSFIAIAGHASQAQQRALAIRSCILATSMGCMFSLFGLKLLQGSGISTAALRIAGGFLLFRTAIDLVSSSGKEGAVATSSSDVMQFAVFPIAFPTIVGPGALCIVADAASKLVDPTIIHHIGFMVAIAAVIGINFTFMWFAPQLLTFMGNATVDLVKRLVGLFLSMVSVQIMIMGCVEVYQGYFQPIPTQNISYVEGFQLPRKTCV